MALKNLAIMQEENLIGHVRDVAGPYLGSQWRSLADHPLVGEASSVGLMASIALTPDKATRAKFASDPGTVGLICRDRCFANNLVMRHVGDRMVIAPPLVIQPDEIDILWPGLMARVRTALDECHGVLKAQGLMQPAP